MNEPEEASLFAPVKVFVPVGQLGAGVRKDEIDAAIARGMDVMAMDAGSTDSGAAYLATGTSKNSRNAVERDLTLLMEAQQRTGVPLIIGTAGQAGGDLQMIKISYPRPTPQGGMVERDLHSGQQYVRLLDIEMVCGTASRSGWISRRCASDPNVY